MTTKKQPDSGKEPKPAAIAAKKKTPQKKKKVAKKEPKKGGRKPWVPDYVMIEKWAAQGLFDKQIAALSGITHQVFSAKKTELPELNACLELGRAKAISAVSTKCVSLAMSGDKDMIKFFLGRRAGWVERIEVDKKNLAEMTTEELLALREKLQNG